MGDYTSGNPFEVPEDDEGGHQPATLPPHTVNYHTTPEEFSVKDYQTAATRVKALETAYLLQWADQAGSGMEQGFRDWAKHEDEASLTEIQRALTQLWAIVHELKMRKLASESGPPS